MQTYSHCTATGEEQSQTRVLWESVWLANRDVSFVKHSKLAKQHEEDDDHQD
jgi:hypothetical protein